MTSDEIARLSAKVELDGVEVAVTKLRTLDGALGSTARASGVASAKMRLEAAKTSAAYQAMEAQQAKSLRRMKSAALVGGSALAAVSAGALAYGIKLNAQWESQNAAFTTMLGSAKKAKDFVEELRTVSSKSPLRLTEYAEGAKMLLGFGMAAEKVVPTLSAVNKAVVTVGKGEAEMKRIVLALGQMQGTGKATAEELRQLAEVGVPVNKILQKELKLTGEEVKGIAESSISSGKVISAIVRGWNKEFGEGYKNAADTFNFQFNAARKTFEQFLRVATFPAFEALRKDVLPAVNEELAKLITVIENPRLTGEQKWARIGTWFDSTMKKLGNLANEAGPKIVDAIAKTLPAIERVLAQLVPIVSEALGRLAAAAIPVAILAGVNIAKGLVKGFAESDWLGKLLIGGWLFKAFGGFAAMNAAGFGIGAIISRGIASGMAAGQSASLLAKSFGRGALASSAAGMGAAGMQMASGLFKGFARAVPILGVAFGLTEVVSKAISGDMKSAGVQGGGMLAGALIGTAIAPGVGTAIGAGIGAIAAPLGMKLVEGITGGATAAMPTLQASLAEGAARVAQAIAAENTVLEALATATSSVSAARDRARAATANLRAAEANLGTARATYGPQSTQAMQAELALARAKERQAAATRDATKAERLQGVARQAAMVTTRASAAEQKEQTLDLLSARDIAERQFRRVMRSETATTEQRLAASRRYTSAANEAKESQVRFNRTIQVAAQEIGPKFAKQLQSLTPAQLRYGRNWLELRGKVKDSTSQVNQAVRGMTDKQVRDWARANNLPGAYVSSIEDLRRKVASSMRSLPTPVQNSLVTVNRSFQNNASAIASFSPGAFGVAKRKGGDIGVRDESKYHGTNGLVPVRVAPGEMIAYRNRSMIVPGRNDKQDSVGMMLPVGSQVFTYSGQEMLARGYSREYALRNQVPHFATGGLVRPRITGGTPKGRNIGNLATDKTVKIAWGRLKEIHAAAKKLWTGGAGTQRSYPGLSGDTDFVPALGWMLSALARSTVGNISVTSGYRSVSEQAALFAANPNPRMVAPPGKSNHGRGIAADISPQRPSYGGQQSKFGLTFPMSWEPWHIELAGNPQFPALSSFVRAPKFRKGGKAAPWLRRINNWGPNQLATLAAYVGLPNPGLFSQIAQGESGGRRTATNLNTNGTIDRGLWQINSVHGFSGDAFDPVSNALMAKAVYDKQGIGAWYAPPTGRAGVVDPEFMRKIMFSPAERNAARKKARAKLGTLRSLRDTAKAKGVKSPALNKAFKNARKALAAAKNNKVSASGRFLAKANSFGKKARGVISAAKVPKSDPNDLKPSGLANLSSAASWDSGKPISASNFPGKGYLPKSILPLLGSPNLSPAARESILQAAVDAASLTDTKVDDAAAYGALLSLNRKNLSKAKGRVTNLNKKIAAAGGRSKLKSLTNQIGSLGARIKKAKKRGDEDAVKKLTKARKGKIAEKNNLSGLFTSRDDALSAVATAQSGITSAQGQLDSLGSDSSGSSEGADLANELKALREAIEKQNELQRQTQAVAGGEIGRAVKDWLSGELVGKGVGAGYTNSNVRY